MVTVLNSSTLSMSNFTHWCRKRIQNKILLSVCVAILGIVLSCSYANADIADFTPLAQEQEENPDWLQSRVSGNGLLFCFGKKGQDIVECKNDRVKGVRSDLNRIVLTGWRLIQVLPDEQRGIWYFFFQR